MNFTTDQVLAEVGKLHMQATRALAEVERLKAENANLADLLKKAQTANQRLTEYGAGLEQRIKELAPAEEVTSG